MTCEKFTLDSLCNAALIERYNAKSSFSQTEFSPMI